MNTKNKALCGVALLLMCALSVAGQIEKKLQVDKKAVRDWAAQHAGRFRVTLTGFTVNKQTSDNILESDGKGDEVYFVIDSARYDGYSDRGGAPLVYAPPNGRDRLVVDGNITERHSLQSVVLGDVNNQNNPPRICAGSMSHAGGLRTGDRYPTNEPWNVSGALRTDRLPMLLWEGELRDQRDLLVLIPTIWEWDGGNMEMRAQYTDCVNRCLTTSGPLRWDYIPGRDVLGAGDRPIGLVHNGNDWKPSELFLTFATAQRAATTSPSRYGTGVVELRYGFPPNTFEPTEDYSIYLKIERLP
jgi:hypothetical protein